MIDNLVIENALNYAKDFFENEASGHDYFHTLRVYKMAVKLAQKENANIEIVSLSALLHDVDDRKISEKTQENKDNARAFLSTQNIDKETIEKIVKIIDEVSFKGTESVVPQSIEGKCVQDADRLDAIGAVGIARAFAFGGNKQRKMYDSNIKPKENMNAQEYQSNDNSTTLNHFYEKLFLLKDMMNTDSAKEIADKRDAFMRAFVSEFLNECGECD